MNAFPPVLALIGNLGTSEILFILLLLLLLFGAHKIPELARSLGRAQREFNKAREEIDEPAPSEDERIRKAARDLGITTEGKSTDELRTAMAEKLK